MKTGDVNGFRMEKIDATLEDDTCYVKIGSTHHALLIAAKGYTSSGQHYWEFRNGINNVTKDAVNVEFSIGVIPRSITQGVDIDNTMENNGGICARLVHGSGGFEFGDHIGLHLDCNGESASLRFFKNGKFCKALTVTGIPTDRLLYPALCLRGHERAHCAFSTVPNPPMPNLVEHKRAEEAYLAETKAMKTVGRRHLSDDQMRQISIAHRRGTVEISSSLHDDLTLTLGDAILFVEQQAEDDGRWEFEIADQQVLAQDSYYYHQEFDLHSPSPGNVLKVAYKFVAISPGSTQFRSCYKLHTLQAPQWKQGIRIHVRP